MAAAATRARTGGKDPRTLNLWKWSSNRQRRSSIGTPEDPICEWDIPMSFDRTQVAVLPSKLARVRDVELKKKMDGIDLAWQDRRVVLSDNFLHVARLNSDRVVECIPLHEIMTITKKVPPRFTEEDLLGKHQYSKRAATEASSSNRELGARTPSRVNSTVARQAASSSPLSFEITTTETGYCQGKTHWFQCRSETEADEWVQNLKKLAKACARRHDVQWNVTRFQRAQHKVRRLYNSNYVQFIVATLIVGNFAVSIYEAEVVPSEGSELQFRLDVVDKCFTAFFTVELVINMWAHWCLPFFLDGWNLFDFVVVTISLISIPLENAPGFNILRLLRVFRVIRLFKRLTSLRILIHAITSAIIPVINAFVVLLIVTAVYSVLAVMLFRERSPELFGTFSQSIFTMVQACTGDSWASSIARPMFKDQETGEIDMDLAIFFISYVLIVGAFLLNIVIAVLLDEFISSVESEKHKERMELIAVHEREFLKSQGALDRLCFTLTEFNTPAELDKEIHELFQSLDRDESGRLSYDEFQEGLSDLPFHPPIRLTREQFEKLAPAGEIECGSFVQLMKEQLSTFTHKFIAHKMRDSSDDQYSLFVALKAILLLQQQQMGEAKTGSSGGGDQHSTSRRREQATMDDMAARLQRIEELLLRGSGPAGEQQGGAGLLRAGEALMAELGASNRSSADGSAQTAVGSVQEGDGGARPEREAGALEEAEGAADAKGVAEASSQAGAGDGGVWSGLAGSVRRSAQRHLSASSASEKGVGTVSGAPPVSAWMQALPDTMDSKGNGNSRRVEPDGHDTIGGGAGDRGGSNSMPQHQPDSGPSEPARRTPIHLEHVDISANLPHPAGEHAPQEEGEQEPILRLTESGGESVANAAVLGLTPRTRARSAELT